MKNLQMIDGHPVWVRTHKTTRHQFIVRLEDGAVIPSEMAGVAAERDAWMRNVVCNCAGCGAPVKAGEMESGYCPTCFDEQGEENARLDAGLPARHEFLINA